MVGGTAAWFILRQPEVERFGANGDPTIVVIGDSYSSGFGENETSWPEIVAAETGHTVASAAVPMSGYAVPERPFSDQLARVADLDPDVVIIAGSRNDRSRLDQFPNAAMTLWDAAAIEFPRAEIIVIGPMWDATDAPADVLDMDSRMAAAAGADSLAYVSGVDWLAGKNDLMQADNMHPDDEAQRLLADRIKESLSL